MKGTQSRYLRVKYFWIWKPWSPTTKSSIWSPTEQCALFSSSSPPNSFLLFTTRWRRSFQNFETSTLNGIRQGAIRLVLVPDSNFTCDCTFKHSVDVRPWKRVSKMSFSSLPCHLNPGISSQNSKSVPNLPSASNLVNRVGAVRAGANKVLKPSIIKQRHSLNKQIKRVEPVIFFCNIQGAKIEIFADFAFLPWLARSVLKTVLKVDFFKLWFSLKDFRTLLFLI